MSRDPESPRDRKKGLHPMAWGAVGCATAIVVVVAVLVIVGVFAFGNFRRARGDGADGPGAKIAGLHTAVRMWDRLNPDFEVEESDDGLRIRRGEDGAEVEVGFEELERMIEKGEFDRDFINGLFPMFGDPSDPDESGAGATKLPKATTVEEFLGQVFPDSGAVGDARGLPSWVYRYPGAETDRIEVNLIMGRLVGTFEQRTGDTVEQVVTAAVRALDDRGFELQPPSRYGTMVTIISQRSDEATQTLMVQESGSGAFVRTALSGPPR